MAYSYIQILLFPNLYFGRYMTPNRVMLQCMMGERRHDFRSREGCDDGGSLVFEWAADGQRQAGEIG